ncbi:hypothetical protein BHE74_00051878 [Ensete ventricosum]|nr:hypothetical protein BHE74_00051878 [Ensete ventricosum]
MSGRPCRRQPLLAVPLAAAVFLSARLPQPTTPCGLVAGSCLHLLQPGHPLNRAPAIIGRLFRGLAVIDHPYRWPGHSRPPMQVNSMQVVAPHPANSGTITANRCNKHVE